MKDQSGARKQRIADLNTENLLARLRSHVWVLALVWTVCIAVSLCWNLYEQDEKIIQIAHNTAQIRFENDVLYRRWTAMQGGVYVPVSERTPPNPYLIVPNRDVTTTYGLALTLVNPAYMSRQVNEMGAESGSRGHITSLKPIRPENAPDAWEAAALRSFEQGAREVSSVEHMSDGEYLRLMRPFVTEAACLKCHAAQGYYEGDIRGGVSVSVPLGPLRAIEKHQKVNLAVAHLALWLIGVMGIGVSKRSLGREMLARERIEQTLCESEERLKRAQEIAHLGSWELDLGNNRLSWSDEVYRIFGMQPQEFDATYEAFLAGVHPDDRSAVDDAYSGSLRDGRDTYEIEHRVVRKGTGEVRTVHEKCEHFRDASGRIVRSVGMVHDITERKNAEDELHHSKEQWEQTFETVPDLVAILDQHHRIVRVNRAMADRLGVTPDRCIGLRCYEAVHGMPERPGFCPHSLTCQDGQQHVAEVHEPRLGGHFLVSTTPLRDAQGQLIGAVHVARDITERKAAEQELQQHALELQKLTETLEQRVQERTAELARANELLEKDIEERKRAEEAVETERKRFYDVLETLPAYLILLTPDYHVSFANRFFRDRFGDDHGQRCFEFLFGRSEPCEICETYTVLKTMEPHEWEWTGPDGRTYHIFDFPFIDTDGSTLILEMGIDITDRKRAEQALRENEELLSTVLNTLPVGVWILDQHGRILQGNPAGEQIWAGIRFVDIDHYGEYQAWWVNTGKSIEPGEWAGARAVTAGETSLDEEIEIECFDGTRKIILNSAVPIRNAQEEVTGAVVIEQDISRRKAVEAEARWLQAELAHRDRVGTLNALTGALAHEINQPLAAILSNAQAALRLLSASVPDIDEVHEALCDIVADDKRAGEVIQRLRTLYKKEEPKREPFDLNTVIASVTNLLHSEVVMRNVVLVHDLGRGVSPVTGDSVQIQQVIMNILLNALHAVHDQPVESRRVEISTRMEENQWVMACFRDTGPGIAVDNLTTIFDPFYTTKSGGSGLGLAICRTIIQAHQGRLWAENHPEGGAMLYFRLPV